MKQRKWYERGRERFEWNPSSSRERRWTPPSKLARDVKLRESSIRVRDLIFISCPQVNTTMAMDCLKSNVEISSSITATSVCVGVHGFGTLPPLSPLMTLVAFHTWFRAFSHERHSTPNYDDDDKTKGERNKTSDSMSQSPLNVCVCVCVCLMIKYVWSHNYDTMIIVLCFPEAMPFMCVTWTHTHTIMPTKRKRKGETR